MKNTESVKAFGLHLRKLREQRGWSQQELADEADVSKLTIQRVELGKNTATLDILLSLSNALDVEMRELMDFKKVS